MILSKIKYILTEKVLHITAYGTFILAIFTGILAYGTWILAKKTSFLVDEGKEQRKELSYRANGEFVYQFYKDFFSPEFRKFIPLMDMNQLIFISDPSNNDTLKQIAKRNPKDFQNGFPKNFSKGFPKDFPIFWIRNRYSGILNGIDLKKKYITNYEMDDIVLNPLDNLGHYFSTKIIIDTSYIHTVFGWYIDAVWENRPIKEYVIWLRKLFIDETAHLHGIEYLYKILRDKYDKPENYADSIVYDKRIKCNNGTFIWRRPSDPNLRHE